MLAAKEDNKMIIFPTEKNPYPGTLIYDREGDSTLEKKVSVYYKPSIERLEEAKKNLDEIISRKKILDFYSCGDLTIYPINTKSDQDSFMQSKYSHIESIKLIGFDFEIPKNIEDVKGILEEDLPKGFIKDYDFGLGLQREYRFIINAIERNEENNALIISKDKEIQLNSFEYLLDYSKYEAIRKKINKITIKYQEKALNEKSVLTYNELLNTINQKKYPEEFIKYDNKTISKIILSNNFNVADLSVENQKDIINIVPNILNILDKKDPEVIVKLHNDIEIITLEKLISTFDKNLNNPNLKEAYWQKLLSENSFILNLAFGYPISIVSEQAHVGGMRTQGDGGKISDFLVKNKNTNNTALIEIKTPHKDLLCKKEYRKNISAPSKELSGSINQILDQKYELQKSISAVKDTSRIHDIETYAIKCVLIIGQTPTDDKGKKSFELFRGNSKNVDIITFDELLERLNQLRAFLAPDKV